MLFNLEQAQREAEFESIAMQLGLEIDRIALQLVSAPSPTNRRQIVRKVKIAEVPVPLQI